MRLVHREKRDAVFAQQIPHPLLREAFGRGVDEPGASVRKSVESGKRLVVVLRRVQRHGGQAARVQRPQLVAHQRDQRRGDDDEAGMDEGGELIEQRFARSRRHDGQRVAAGEKGGEHVGLTGEEVVEAKFAAQQFAQHGGLMLREDDPGCHGSSASSAAAISAHSASSGPSRGGRPARAYQ